MDIRVLTLFSVFMIMVVLFYNKKEGFVKYYQQPNVTGRPDYLGNTLDDSGIYPSNLGNIIDVPLKYIPSRKDLAVSLAKITEADSDKRISLLKDLEGMQEYESTIDVLYLDKVIAGVMSRVTAVGKGKYKAGKPYSISVYAFPNGTRRMIFSIDIQDISDTQVSAYMNRVSFLGYLTGDSQFYIASVEFLDAGASDSTGVLGYDSKALEVAEIENSLNLVYPWKTTEQKVTFNADAAAKVLSEKAAKASEDNFFCFGAAGTGNVVSKETCLRAGGFTDTPVVDPSTCQYYNANKNYPNKRGGIRGNGYCEGPIGTQTQGFSKFVDPALAAPFCYNCKAGVALNGKEQGMGPCCNDQANNLQEYNLLSPDYAFPGDAMDRRQFASEFKARGLSWHRFGPQD